MEQLPIGRCDSAPPRRSLWRLVAHRSADSPSTPRHATSPQRASTAPFARHRLDIWRLSTTPTRCAGRSSTSTAAPGPSATSANKAARCCMSSFVEAGSSSRATTDSRRATPGPRRSKTRRGRSVGSKRTSRPTAATPTASSSRAVRLEGTLRRSSRSARTTPTWRPEEMDRRRGLVRARRALLLRRARDDGRRDALAGARRGSPSPARAPRGAAAVSRTTKISTAHSRRTSASRAHRRPSSSFRA